MNEENSEAVVWVFNGGGQFPSGVFSTRENAEKWIEQHKLSGCLTMYPLDKGSYDWAIEKEYFKPKRDEQKTAKFIQAFACGDVHFHYEDGTQQ